MAPSLSACTDFLEQPQFSQCRLAPLADLLILPAKRTPPHLLSRQMSSPSDLERHLYFFSSRAEEQRVCLFPPAPCLFQRRAGLPPERRSFSEEIGHVPPQFPTVLLSASLTAFPSCVVGIRFPCSIPPFTTGDFFLDSTAPASSCMRRNESLSRLFFKEAFCDCLAEILFDDFRHDGLEVITPPFPS